MPIKKIDEFPEGSGSLSNDDIFLFMDDPSGGATTKKISLSQISSAIGGAAVGSSFNQDLNTYDSPVFNTVQISGSKILGGGTNSGDGNGYGTLELVPDSELYSGDQYLIVDPTGPNHIHLRSGGVQDGSNAEIIIGGEKNNLRVNDQNPLARLQTESLITLNTYYLVSPEFSSAVWETFNGINRLVINNPTPTVYDAVWALTGASFLSVVDDNGNYYELTSNGSSTPGGSSPVMVYVDQAPTTSPITLTQLTFEIRQNKQTFLEASGNDIRIEAADDVRIYSNDSFRLYNYSANDPIEIFTDYNNQEYRWRFMADGSTCLPDGKPLNFGQNTNTLGPPVSGGGTDRVRLWDFDGTGSNFNYAIGAEGNHVWFAMDVNNGTGGFKFYSRDNQIFKISDDGKLYFDDGTIQTTAWTGSVSSSNTFTPSYAASGATQPIISYATRYGFYQKIDNAIYFTIRIKLSNKTANGVGNLIISGLPFVSNTGDKGYSTGSIVSSAFSSNPPTNWSISPNTSHISLYTSTGSLVSVDSPLSTAEMFLSGFYFI